MTRRPPNEHELILPFVPPEDVRGDRLLLAGERLRHVRTVLRLGPGDECSVTDGAGAEYLVRVEHLGRDAGRAVVLRRTEPQRESGLVTWLALAVPKGDRFSFVLEKAVELGVSGVIPVLSRRTVRAPRAEAAACVRWQRIAEGAVAQSGRTRVPATRHPTPLDALLGDRNLPGLRILIWEQASAGLCGHIESCAPPPAVLVAVGPEGGWSPEEAQQAQAAGFLTARLGPPTTSSLCTYPPKTEKLVLGSRKTHAILGDFRKVHGTFSEKKRKDETSNFCLLTSIPTLGLVRVARRISVLELADKASEKTAGNGFRAGVFRWPGVWTGQASGRPKEVMPIDCFGTEAFALSGSAKGPPLTRGRSMQKEDIMKRNVFLAVVLFLALGTIGLLGQPATTQGPEGAVLSGVWAWRIIMPASFPAANPDMVGHSGNLQAAIQAIETVDICIGKVVGAQKARGGEVLVTADHGNAELMLDPVTGQAHTAHTLNLVPLIYVGRRHASLAEIGALEDISPTLLKMMGLPKPPEMTGQALVQFE